MTRIILLLRCCVLHERHGSTPYTPGEHHTRLPPRASCTFHRVSVGYAIVVFALNCAICKKCRLRYSSYNYVVACTRAKAPSCDDGNRVKSSTLGFSCLRHVVQQQCRVRVCVYTPSVTCGCFQLTGKAAGPGPQPTSTVQCVAGRFALRTTLER